MQWLTALFKLATGHHVTTLGRRQLATGHHVPEIRSTMRQNTTAVAAARVTTTTTKSSVRFLVTYT